MTMSEIVVGIVAGVVVALASQVISYLFDRRKERQEEG